MHKWLRKGPIRSSPSSKDFVHESAERRTRGGPSGAEVVPPKRPSARARTATRRVQPRLFLRFEFGGEDRIGPGKVALLEAIERERSISAAARAMGMSYRRAWLLVDTMNRCFREPVVTAEAGGAQGGGTALTPLGKAVVAHYRAAEAKAAKAAEKEIAALQALLR